MVKTGALIRLAAISGACAVMAGAFGAHGVAGKPAEWLKTGGEYELIHALAAIVAAQLGAESAALLLLGGSVIFAATLYAMAFGAPHVLGAVTPVGGVGMILGWLMFAWRGAAKARKR
jgi:uncharacterized membrane protein YgdD (TMEM256/DUF423 family)